MARFNIKKITAVAAAAAVMSSMTACGENGALPLTAAISLLVSSSITSSPLTTAHSPSSMRKIPHQAMQ